MNVYTLRDDLFQSDILIHLKIKTHNDLETWILQQNDKLSKLSEKKWLLLYQKENKKINIKTFEVAYKKAKEYNFYLGLTSSWIDIS